MVPVHVYMGCRNKLTVTKYLRYSTDQTGSMKRKRYRTKSSSLCSLQGNTQWREGYLTLDVCWTVPVFRRRFEKHSRDLFQQWRLSPGSHPFLPKIKSNHRFLEKSIECNSSMKQWALKYLTAITASGLRIIMSVLLWVKVCLGLL
jgi:hypothetical protein